MRSNIALAAVATLGTLLALEGALRLVDAVTRLAAPEREGVSLADLATAVKTLPTGQRAAFVLRKVQGLSYAEVSHALECSEEAARSRVAEAMKKVKEAMR